MYVPSTQGDRVISAAEFATRRDETADILVTLFGDGLHEWLTEAYRLGTEGAGRPGRA